MIVAGDLCRDAVAGADFPVIEPDASPILPHPLRNSAHDSLISRAVTEEDVKGKAIRHERQAQFPHLTLL
jgi:hypothetical protein